MEAIGDVRENNLLALAAGHHQGKMNNAEELFANLLFMQGKHLGK